MILDRRGVCCHRNSTYELDGLCSACLNSKRDFMLAAICSQLKGFRPLFHLRPMAKYNGSYFSYALDMLIHFRVSFCNRTLSEVYRWCVRIIYIYYIYILIPVFIYTLVSIVEHVLLWWCKYNTYVTKFICLWKMHWMCAFVGTWKVGYVFEFSFR